MNVLTAADGSRECDYGRWTPAGLSEYVNPG